MPSPSVQISSFEDRIDPDLVHARDTPVSEDHSMPIPDDLYADDGTDTTEPNTDDESDQEQDISPLTTVPKIVPGKSRQETLNEKLERYRDFLRSPGPNDIGYSFLLEYRRIQKFHKRLAGQESGNYDQGLFDEVQSWLENRHHLTVPARQYDFLDSLESETRVSESHKLLESKDPLLRPMKKQRGRPKGSRTAVTQGDRSRVKHAEPVTQTKSRAHKPESSQSRNQKSKTPPRKRQRKDLDPPTDRSQSEELSQLEQQLGQDESVAAKNRSRSLSIDKPKRKGKPTQLPQFLFGETNHLQTSMHNLIERDLALSMFPSLGYSKLVLKLIVLKDTKDSKFEPAMPMTVKFSLPEAPPELVAEAESSFISICG